MIRKLRPCLFAALVLVSADTVGAIPQSFEAGSGKSLIVPDSVANLTLEDPGTITNTDGKTIPW